MTGPRPHRPSPHARPEPAQPRVRRVASLVAAAGMVAGLAGVAAPAAAHDELVGTTPADASSVEVPPAAVELTFRETPLALGSQVQVTGPDGEVVNAGDLQVLDAAVSQPLASDLPAGDYTVAWRVTSSDGHPISGELRFTALAGAAGEEPPTTPAPGDAATPGPGATTAAPEPTRTADAVPAPDPGGDDGAAVVSDPSPGAAPWIVGALVVLLVGGTLWWVARRRATPQPQG